MAGGIFSHGERAHPLFFWLGAAAVTGGVLLHLPMYIRSASMNFHVAGMPLDWEMYVGMILILGGTAAGFYGLLPAALRQEQPLAIAASAAKIRHDMPEETGRLKWSHWQLLLVLTLGVI